MANEHNTVSWGASLMELTNGTKQPIKSGTTTTDVSGRLVADTIYYLYWTSNDPSVWHTQIASLWNTNPSSGKVRVATLTGVASGGKAQVKMLPTAAVSGQDAINANQTVNQDSVTGTEIGTVGSVATTGLRVKMATSGTGAAGSGSAGNFLRGYSANSVSDTTGAWLDIDGDDESISIRNGAETSILLSKFDSTGIHFYDGSANNYILSGFNATGMKFYSGTAAAISAGTTRAHYSGTAMTFYNASGLADGNELVSLGVGSSQGLNLFGSNTNTTHAALIRYQARVGGSWATRGYQGLFNDGSVDHLISFAPNSKVWLISDNAGNNTTVGSTIQFQTISRPSADSAGWKMHSSSDSGDVFRNYFFPINGGSGSNIAGDLTPDGTDDGHYNYIGFFDTDTRDSEGTMTGSPTIAIVQSYYSSIGDGTASLPALYFDVDTGVYSPSDNAVGITAGGSLVAQFDSSGVTIQGALARTAGVEDMWVPAAAMRPASTNGCSAIADVESTATRPDMQVLDFHQSTQQYAQFSVAMPKSWNEGTITAQFYWTHATAVSTDVMWAIQGVCVSDNDTIDIAYGTAVTITDTFHNTAEDLAVSAATSAVTLAGSPAAGDLAFFQVYRDADAGGDTTNSTVARLVGVKIHYTTNAATDA